MFRNTGLNFDLNGVENKKREKGEGGWRVRGGVFSYTKFSEFIRFYKAGDFFGIKIYAIQANSAI